MTKTGKPKDKKECLKCGKSKNIRDFYMSNSSNHIDNKYPICKTCIKKNLNIDKTTDFYSNDFLEKFQNIMLEMNRPFIYSLWLSSVDEHKNTGKDLFGLYLKNVILNFKTFTWKDSEFGTSTLPNNSNITQMEIIDSNDEKVKIIDNRDKDDVIRMLGYDPFEYEHPNDKEQLYHRLVDFLDESTLEDGFKLQAVIEIVKGFNQIDKINQAITTITNDVNSLSTNSGGIKSLIASKKSILDSLVKLAEENGLSVKHNNQKSKGAGTLSGIIKTLQEKGIEEGEVNLFDIETAKGMRQVADLSNKSIIAQLQFDENDYTQMIMEQREMIQDLDSKVIKLEEENRLLKKELIKYKHNEGGDIDES